MNDENKELDPIETADELPEIEEPRHSAAAIELPSEAGSARPAREKGKAIKTVYDYLETFCFALAAMIVLFLFVFRVVTVDGDSMRETLHDGDRLIISNMFYSPKTGDIVVINPENHSASDEPIIKRVIASGGQTVFIDYENWEVYVDGEKLDEPYIAPMREFYGGTMNVSTVPEFRGEFVVDEGKVFVMGDNRNNSTDSRSPKYGEIGENRILGRVLFRLYPDIGSVE